MNSHAKIIPLDRIQPRCFEKLDVDKERYNILDPQRD